MYNKEGLCKAMTTNTELIESKARIGKQKIQRILSIVKSDSNTTCCLTVLIFISTQNLVKSKYLVSVKSQEQRLCYFAT